MTNNLWFLPKKPNTKRILFHAINHIGLGHINRSIAVAQWLQASIADLQVLFLIEGGEDFIEPTGFPWILVPGQAAESEHCDQITRNVLHVFRPDLMIHETLLREQIHRPVREAGVRQVVMGNIGDLLRGQLRENISMMNEVNLLLILQRIQEVLPSDQALVARYSGRTMFAGPLVRQKYHLAGDDLRRKLGLTSAHKIILLTFGGGGWDIARVILSRVLAARAQILENYPQAKVVVITGPHFSGELPEKDEFVAFASRFEPFLTDYINIASAVVCMAGYSTVNEIAASGIPAICIPAVEAEDQVGVGGMGEYAQSFPNITTLTNTDTEVVAHQVIEALAKERDLSVTQEFWRRAQLASQSIVGEIKSLLTDTHLKG